jgi:Ca2+-binding EF-hand superfamily protein
METFTMSIRFLAAIPLAVVITSAAIAAGTSLDYNGDGKISREEFRNEAAKTAFGADKNKNGFIDEDEYKLDDSQRKKVDGNGDGKVSVEEFQTGQMAGFDALDKNSDGFLDASEMRG